MSESITVTINGQELQAQSGSLLIDVADDNNIVIPRFCYHKKLSVAANCRMCLVEIARAPKPMPACATQVADGMVVNTRSKKALDAQKSTMEFLLINHPLDCPICDQGGECELQDVAMGFGEGISQYTEQKRVVMDKNIGPLIATDFTRCIHCTRCVRFSDEITGLQELGATGRGEHVEIGTYIAKSVGSELSGNVIDICPVGALTAKPSRYTARPWELTQHATVSPHDCVGSNLFLHSRTGRVMRVVPRENESINESWISDRDRFSYSSIQSDKRCRVPMVRENGKLKEITWESAIEIAVDKLGAVANKDADKLAMLISPQATLEEHFLSQKLLRGLGSNHIDHRIGQVDFQQQDKEPVMPWLGRSIESLESLDAALVIGANLRFEQPILAHRLRKAAIHNGAKVATISHLSNQGNFDLLADMNGSRENQLRDLAAIAASIAKLSETGITSVIKSLTDKAKPDDGHRAVAKALLEGEQSAIIVGLQAIANPYLSNIRALCEYITSATGSTLGYLSTSSNSAGACLSGSLPHRKVAAEQLKSAGQNVMQIMASKHEVLITFGLNPECDLASRSSSEEIGRQNDFIIAFDNFENEFNQANADLILPLAVFAETSGTFVNVEGLWQSFKGCVNPVGEARPGWKILASLGQLLLPGEFAYQTSIDVKDEVRAACSDLRLNNLTGFESSLKSLPAINKSLQPNVLLPLYSSDELTRFCVDLQKTSISRAQNSVVMNAEQATKLKLLDAETVQIKSANLSATLPIRIDEAVADGCICIPAGLIDSGLKETLILERVS
ncbi:MAG: NADH-quinone oxidoreductase subunit G [Gammaproteobacteria bacterium]|jgi:NADH-quinone oxidoreductase subunit G